MYVWNFVWPFLFRRTLLLSLRRPQSCARPYPSAETETETKAIGARLYVFICVIAHENGLFYSLTLLSASLYLTFFAFLLCSNSLSLFIRFFLMISEFRHVISHIICSLFRMRFAISTRILTLISTRIFTSITLKFAGYNYVFAYR